MNKNFIYSLVVVGTLILSVAYFFILHPYIIQAYDTWMDFNYPSYENNKGHYYQLGVEWQKKPSAFLYRQLKLPNSKPRKGLALGILSERKDSRVLPMLKSIILNGDPDLNFQASRCLTLFGTKETAPVFMEIVNKYKNIKFYASDKKTRTEGSRFFHAIFALSELKYEPAYPIILELAKKGTDREKKAVYNGALYQYDNHTKEILPLYIDRLKNCPDKFKGQEISNLKRLNHPEAIPRRYANLS
jgi:hypothetical protein